MKMYMSLSYKSFPEYADQPNGNGERQFNIKVGRYLSSLAGIKACGVIVLLGIIGLGIGFHFSVLVSAAAAGIGVFVGFVALNASMYQSIRIELETEKMRRAKIAALEATKHCAPPIQRRATGARPNIPKRRQGVPPEPLRAVISVERRDALTKIANTGCTEVSG